MNRGALRPLFLGYLSPRFLVRIKFSKYLQLFAVLNPQRFGPWTFFKATFKPPGGDRCGATPFRPRDKMPSQSSALIHCGQFSNPLRRIPHLVAPRDDGPWQLMVQKSGYSNQLRLVIYPIIYRIFNGFLYIPSSKGFLNHQQYHQFNGHQFGGSFPFCQNCNGYLSNEGKMKSVMPCLEAQLQNIHSNTSTNILMLQSAHLSSQCAQSNCTVATNAGRLKAMRYTPWHFVQCKQEIPKIFLRL